jgi:hypothetical protein
MALSICPSCRFQRIESIKVDIKKAGFIRVLDCCNHCYPAILYFLSKTNAELLGVTFFITGNRTLPLEAIKRQVEKETP